MSEVNQSRRRALKLGVAAGAACLTSKPTWGEEAMLTRAIPSSGEALPVIGLGTSRVFDVGGGETERAPLREVLRLMDENGATVIDSSPMYGQSEAVVGDLASGLGIGAQLFYATKVWTDGQSAGVRQMNESFELLETDRVDLLAVHNLRDWRIHLETLRAWKEEGRVRYIGITHYVSRAFDDLARLIESQELDFVQFNYSLGEREAEQSLLQLCADKGVATMINRPYQRGALFAAVRGHSLPDWAGEFGAASWGQFFLKYVLSHPAVTCVIPATSKPKHAIDNLAAGYGRLPNEKMRARTRAFITGL